MSKSEPVLLTEAKLHLNKSTDEENDKIKDQIREARRHIEDLTGRSIIEKTWTLSLPAFCREVILPKPPVVDITSVDYYNTDSPEVLTTWGAANYRLDRPGHRLLLVPGVTLPATANRHDAVQITYRTGYIKLDSPEVLDVPWSLRAAIKLVVSDLYENREAQSQLRLQNNERFMSLISPYRVMSG